MKILSSSDYIEMPWKNGGGVTQQLAISEDLHPIDGLPLWRLSIATVAQDGPFSVFENYQRCIMLLDGNGMQLKFNNGNWINVDKPLQYQLFSGSWQTDCKLIDGAIKDFNLMVDERRADFSVEVLSLKEGQSKQLEPLMMQSNILLLYVIQGELMANFIDKINPERTHGKALLKHKETLVLNQEKDDFLSVLHAQNNSQVFLGFINYK